MESKQPFLSLCIPTYGKIEWIIPVIDSIYEQGVDNNLFEVVITDNGGKPDLAEAVKRYTYDNFHYYQTNSQGFTNQIDAFEKCSGVFCKMLNHRSKMMPGSIEAILNIIRRYEDEKPILYFAEGHAKGGEFIECTDTNEFVQSLGYWTSWSSGTGAWQDDLKDIRHMPVNKMFPHTLFLFALRQESKYIIWNGKYELMADDAGKGGYDLFRTFGVSFLDILNDLRISRRISSDTFVGVKKEVFSFLVRLYLNEVILPTKHTFIIDDIHKSIEIYYGKADYYVMVLIAWLKAPFSCIRRMLRKTLCRLHRLSQK